MPDPDSEQLGDDLARVQEILRDAESTTRLTRWEDEFLDSLRERVLKYGDTTLVSARQWSVLNRIEARLYQ